MSEGLHKEVKELGVRLVQRTMELMSLRQLCNNLREQVGELHEEVYPVKAANKRLEAKLTEVLAENKLLKYQVEQYRQKIGEIDAGLPQQGEAGSNHE